MQKLGDKGERLAANYLKAQGYKILNTNYRTRLGEIDIVAQEGETLCFIEVKMRTSSVCGTAAESVPYFKQRKIARTASLYIGHLDASSQAVRFDVVAIDNGAQDSPTIRLIKNAFDLAF